MKHLSFESCSQYLIDELHVLNGHFRASLTTHNDDHHFGKLQTLFDEVNDRSALGRPHI